MAKFTFNKEDVLNLKLALIECITSSASKIEQEKNELTNSMKVIETYENKINEYQKLLRKIERMDKNV